MLFLAIQSIGQTPDAVIEYCANLNNDTSRICKWYHEVQGLNDVSKLSEIARSSVDASLNLLWDAKFAESILYNEFAGEIWLGLDSIEQYGNCMAYIGRAHYRLGNIYDALRWANRALMIAENGQFLVLKSTAHRFLSWDYWRIKQCDDALYHISEFKRAIDDAVIPESNLATYFNGLAKFKYCKGDVELALSYTDSTYYHAVKHGDDRAVSLALSNKVNYLSGIGRLDEQLILAKRALAISRELNDIEQIESNLGVLGGVYIRSGRFEEAVAAGLESLKIATEINDKPRVHVAYVILRKAYAGIGNYQAALDYELRAEDIFLEVYGLKNMDRIFALEKDRNRVLQEIQIQEIAREQEIADLNHKQEKQVYFIVAIASLVLLIIALVSWYKYRQSKEKETWMLKQMYEGELNKHELTSLRAMMNPHFIFNSLNSIKSYIINNKSRMATDYLNKFSVLIRQILNNSRLEKIALSDELSTLDLYIQMEAMRLEDQFEYEISCDDEVNQEDITIAPLIIQPFVENAIWHGLVNKEGERVLKINVSKTENGVSIRVVDNGIGREAAKLLAKKNPLKRKSFGINITESRIKFLSKNKGVKNILSIEDLVDENGCAAGTEVIIQINDTPDGG